MPDQAPQKAGRIEILGAWLGLWTPRRGVHIPPPPSPRRLGVIGLAVAALASAAAAVLVPAIDAGKQRSERAERARLEAARARRAALQREEQRPQRGRLAQRAPRPAALQAVESDVLRDARERFDDRAREVTCEPYPRTVDGRDPGRAVASYACVATTSQIDGGRGVIGIPYYAIVDFPRGRYSFCKIHPVPGERVVPDPRRVVRLPPECDPSRLRRP